MKPAWAGTWVVSTEGIQTYHWEETESVGGQELVITTDGNGNAGGRVQGDGIVCSEEAEYGSAIHCDAGDSGPMLGDGANARGVDI